MSTLVTVSKSKNEATTPGSAYAMPATTLQVRLLNLESTVGPDPAWNIAVRFHLVGPLDRERLERALQRLVARHEALRTCLIDGEHVTQYIAEHATLPVEWCDLRVLEEEIQAAEVTRLSLEHAQQLLTLKTAPLFRVRVLRLAEDEHILLWNAHHAICDGWSIGLLAQDFMDGYSDILRGPEPAKDSLDYGDYAVWLDAQRHTPEYEVYRGHWKRRLRDWTVPPLPTSWRNEIPATAEPEIQSMLLPRRLTDSLAAIAQRHGATFFHAALATFAVLLRSHQESAEVALGTPLSGRDQSELENVVGSFVNYVPLRFQIQGQERFPQFLNSVRALVTDSLEHAQFRFEDMLSDLGRPGAPAAENMLFSAAFICQRDFVRPIVSAGVALTAIPSVTPGAVRPLTVFMVERPDGWRLSCEVDDRAVSSAAGREILESFQRLLAAIAVHAEETIALLAEHAGFGVAAWKSDSAIFPAMPALVSEATRTAGKELAQAPRRVPATEFQRRFWQLDGMYPGRAAFHIRIRLELKGPFNMDALIAAVEQIVRQNEILRTTLEEKEGQIWQLIRPDMPIDFKFLISGNRASGVRSAAQRAADEAVLDDEGRARFSLTEGPLFRVRVLQLDKECHWLAITLSHGIVDGWSAGVFLEQLQRAYDERVAGLSEPAMRSGQVQFSEYAKTEQSLLHAPEKDRRLAWWAEYLRGIWRPLALPRDLNGAAAIEGDVRAGLEVIPLSANAVLSARQFARESQTTLFAIFGALFQALLFRYSGQRDVLFLTPHANRADDTESILGPLAEPICLTGHVEKDTTFRQLVERFSRESLDAMENALPLNVVSPLVDMRVAGGYHPLNQITFFYQRAFVHDMEWHGLKVKSLPDTASVTGSEWQLGIVERDGEIFLEFLYDATRYSSSSSQAVCRHFAQLLTEAIQEPEKALSQIEILSSEELKQQSDAGSTLPAVRCLLSQGNVTAADTNSNKTPLPMETIASAEAGTQSERDMRRIWRHLFQVDDLNSNSDFFDLGGHSLLLARLQIALKKEFKVQLTTADLFRNPTIGTLAAWLERSKAASQKHSHAQDDILRIWGELFKMEDLNAESDFFELGGHSLLLTRMQRMLKQEFGVQLTAADLFRNPTIAALGAWLEQAKAAAKLAAAIAAGHLSTNNPRVIPIQPLGTGRPVFVISQSMIFRTLAAELGTDQPVYALQMLDEEITSTAATASYDELIDFYVRLIREVQPAGPYRIAGWCVSGWIAYGVARKLEEDGDEIELLMIMDVWAPGYWHNQPKLRRSLMLAVYNVQRLRALTLRLKRTDMSRQETHIARGLRSYLVAAKNLPTWLREKMPVPKTPLIEEMQGRSHLLEMTAVQAHRTGPLRGKILLFRSIEEPGGPLLAPEMGWNELLGRPAHIELLPGSHREIFDLPGARMMAARAHEILDASAPARSSADTRNFGTKPDLAAKRGLGDAPLVEV